MIRSTKINSIRCSQCDETFKGGFEYRMHWEEIHFYPYLKSSTFDFKTSLRDSYNNGNIRRLIDEISSNI